MGFIFSLCYYGQGGFTQSEAYTLPIHLRRFYLQQVIDAKKQEKENIEKASKRR